ncbi:substrate-binding domain-containing protein [Qipengyuania sp.]|uniref:substrate-binding domain-containing protein n=1 Tax=Qipengyuania sp. TaxID=2004515 RepID=UPI0035C7FA86
MIKKTFTALLCASTLALASCGGNASRDSIRAVGSSTVYPFAKAVAEELVKSDPNVSAPLIESTGSGAGIKLFCAGLGSDTPDIANASRRMKKSEFQSCQNAGVTDILEIQVGLDGIAIASAKGGIDMNLTPALLYRALAARPYGKEQTAQNWSDVDPSLPNEPILVYGPPSTSGTRDALEELILMAGCDADPAMSALKESDPQEHDRVCTEIRSDGNYVDQGEQDNLIVQKIENNPRAVGIFGYSYLEENAERLNALSVNGVKPTYEEISSFRYPGARPLYLYVKKAHLDAIPSLRGFLEEWAQMWDRDGPLAKMGLVASPPDAMARNVATIDNLTTLDGSQLD